MKKYKINLSTSVDKVNTFLEKMSAEEDFELIDIKYINYEFLIIYKIKK